MIFFVVFLTCAKNRNMIEIDCASVMVWVSSMSEIRFPCICWGCMGGSLDPVAADLFLFPIFCFCVEFILLFFYDEHSETQ